MTGEEDSWRAVSSGFERVCGFGGKNGDGMEGLCRGKIWGDFWERCGNDAFKFHQMVSFLNFFGQGSLKWARGKRFLWREVSFRGTGVLFNCAPFYIRKYFGGYLINI